MITLIALVLLSAAPKEVGNLVLDDMDEIPQRIKDRMTQYSAARGASLRAFSPEDGSLLISTRFGDTSQLHRVRGPMMDRKQLTFFNEPIAAAFYDPARPKAGFYFAMDSGGAERYQYYWFDLDAGTNTLLTDGKSRHESPRLSHKTSRLVFAGNARNTKDLDLYVQEGSAAPKLLKEVTGSWQPQDWSPDDKRIVVRQYVSITESYLHVVDASTGASEQLNKNLKVAYGDAVFAQTGNALFYTTDHESEFQRLVHHDLTTNKVTVITPKIDWDVEHVAVTPKWLAFVVNEGGRSVLYRAPASKPTAYEKLELPVGVIANLEFDHKGERLGATITSTDSASDVYVVTMANKKVERWTESEVGGLNPKAFVTPTLITYKSFDGREIPAWFYKPKNAAGPVPVVIAIHGGPEAQSRPDFNPAQHYWVNELGLAVLIPNVRGSAGYGKTYLTLDNAEKREDSVKDIGALLDWIGTQPALDQKRVAVIGGSYGGFMVLASLAMFPERIACGVDVVGISNFVTFLEKTEAYRRDLRRVEYGDERDPKMRELLEKISPTTNAKKITSPLFIVQGKNDPRVPLNEAEQMVKTVRGQGKRVWYLMAKDEGHGFQKKTNRDVYMQSTALFFERYLLQKP
jgi:dipeptidyl aminopeptidase/acylaminoacyl peptidase